MTMLQSKDLPLLAVFASVARLGSFTAAGRELKLTKSVVSHHVLRLEQRCGVRLLERTTRRLRVTQIGEQVLQASAGALNALRDVQLVLDLQRAAPTGTLRVTAPHLLGESFTTPTIARLLLLHPQLRAQVILDDSVRDMISEQFDVGVRFGPIPESTLVVRRLGVCPEIIVGSSGASVDQIESFNPGELRNATWIGHSLLDAGRSWTFRSDNGRTEQLVVTPRVVVSTADAMRTLAVAGVGLAVLPHLMVRDAIASGHLVRICPSWFRRKIALQLVTPTRQVPPRVTAFLALAREAATQLVF